MNNIDATFIPSTLQPLHHGMNGKIRKNMSYFSVASSAQEKKSSFGRGAQGVPWSER